MTKKYSHPTSAEQLREQLETLYAKYNHRTFVAPDPLLFLYDYDDPRDREIVGLIAATLAYGRVSQIMKSVRAVLSRLGRSPATFLMHNDPRGIRKLTAGLQHRFTTDHALAGLLLAVQAVLRKYGSLYHCFLTCLNSDDTTTVPALERFVQKLADQCHHNLTVFTLPRPCKGSACKRLHLFLRWMIRKDAVDPGDWHDLNPALLVVPLDTHMHRIGRALGFTNRQQADHRTALEITEGFKTVSPEDPVRYDFVLTRLAIRQDLKNACGFVAFMIAETFSKSSQLQGAAHRSSPSRQEIGTQ